MTAKKNAPAKNAPAKPRKPKVVLIQGAVLHDAELRGLVLSPLTMDDVDKHLEKFSRELTHESKALTLPHAVMTPAAIGAPAAKAAFDVCKTYRIVRPIIMFAKGILSIFKPKWATALQQFIDISDVSCSLSNPNE